MPPLPEEPALGALTRYWATPRHGCWGPKCVLSRGVRIRLIGLTSGEILPTHGFQDGERTGTDYSRV
jgi:hypothetical protein